MAWRYSEPDYRVGETKTQSWKRWIWEPIIDLREGINETQGHPISVCRFAESRTIEFVRRSNLLKDKFKMAKKKTRESWQTNWIHVDLTPDQKGQYRAWDMEPSDIIDNLGGMLSGGYKLTCNYNHTNSTYQASLICSDEDSVNAGCGVSGYASNMWDAISVVSFKALVVLPEKWSDYQPPGGSDIG